MKERRVSASRRFYGMSDAELKMRLRELTKDERLAVLIGVLRGWQTLIKRRGKTLGRALTRRTE